MKERNKFTYLVTGKKSNDHAAKKYIGENTPYMFFKLPYTPPYERFEGIKKFQASTRFRPFEDTTETEKYAIVNLSEWIGHENEEYLEVFMKFLHDYSDFFEFRYLFTVGDATKNQITKLVLLSSEYLEHGTIYEDIEPRREKENEKNEL